jgi:coenzyme F420-dependent glucose-6-phosphate dehydrogenase
VGRNREVNEPFRSAELVTFSVRCWSGPPGVGQRNEEDEMTENRYWIQLATEQFPPSDLVRQAVAAEAAGFDALNVSDHFQPWWEPGESGQAWILLGAIGQATKRIPIGTGVTAPVHRYNPAVVAQAFATLEQLFPGRAFLGLGSGEALNEVPTGMEWPSPRGQVARLEEALEIITRLLRGERVDHNGEFFRTNAAYLHTKGQRRPPIYISAFGPGAARLAARFGDGMWTLADPSLAPRVVEAYREACEGLRRAPGEIILQSGFSWADEDQAALDGARVWKAAQPREYYSDDWHDPAKMHAKAASEISDEQFCRSYIISSNADEHAERVRGIEKMGSTVVCLQNASGADPHGALRVYGDKVLPRLRGKRL